MRDFVFVLKSDPTKKATLRVDIMDDDFKKFTIMWWEGVSNTIFENYIPWKLGAVISMSDVEEWFAEFQPVLQGFEYGKANGVVTLGADEHVLTLTPSITNGTEATVKVWCKNSSDIIFSKTVVLETGETNDIEIIEGYEYDFELVNSGDTWTSAPDSFVCDGDEAVTLAVSVPIDLPVHTLTITPTLVGGTTTSVTLRGTKSNFTTIDTVVELETAVDKEVDIYEEYSYSFVLGDGIAWTSGSALAAIVCDGDETAAVDLTLS